MSNTSSAPPPGKRKEIYKYEAPWTVYSMNWSIRSDKKFRLALGSFVEEYNNKVVSGIAVSGQNGVSAVQGSTCIFVCVCMF